jgi:hypothetical protein
LPIPELISGSCPNRTLEQTKSKLGGGGMVCSLFWGTIVLSEHNGAQQDVMVYLCQRQTQSSPGSMHAVNIHRIMHILL